MEQPDIKYNNGRLLLVVLFFLLCAGLLFRCLIADDSNEKKNKVAIIEAEKPVQIFLTKEDTLALRDAMGEIDKKIDFYETNSDKMVKQYNRFFGMFQNGSVSQYQTYQAAEAAKETFDRYEHGISKINAPDKLPELLKDTLNSALSDIGNYYSMERDAYNTVMEILNGESDFKKVDKFKELDNDANSFYLRGVRYLYEVEFNLGMFAKHKHKKIRH